MRDQIRRLVEILCDFLPLSSHSANAVTFRSIFKESKVANYLDGPSNKKQVLQQGWERVVRQHPRLPYRMIRKIVPAAIEYRRHKRRPLQQEELDGLATLLHELGYDMRKELAEIDLQVDMPPITVAPEELLVRLEQYDLHPALAREPLQLFRDGHFNEAVRRAAERFESAVRDRSSLADRCGRDLMAQAFRPDGGLLTIRGVKAENERDCQEGYQFLTMGMMAAIRNVFSHGDEERRPPEECFEMLLFLNWLFRQLDQATQSA